ncbi:MAG: hypothetical protein WBV77_06120, partial [Solirubrobacteraceae bacterium]
MRLHAGLAGILGATDLGVSLDVCVEQTRCSCFSGVLASALESFAFLMLVDYRRDQLQELR